MWRQLILALFLFQLTPQCQCRLNMARMQKQLNNFGNLLKATTDLHKATTDQLKYDMEQLQIDLGTEQRKTEFLESKLNETKEELEALTAFHQQPGVPSNLTDKRFDELHKYVDVSVGILTQAVGKEKIKLRKLLDHVYSTAVSNCTNMIEQQKQLIVKDMDSLTATVTDNSKRLEGLEDQFVGLTHLPGVPGEKCERGGKGEKGERGQIGIDGRPGEMGARGSQGMKGDQGSEGDKGDTGEKGERGERGQMGMNGNPGEKGVQGSQGLLGTKGDKGDPGVLVGCSAPKLDVIIPSETEILLYAPGQQISGMTCETGYQLVGDSVLTCRGNDTWQGTASCEQLHICNLQADVGPCKQYIRRWHYNSISQTCDEFTYGGCLGNHNNFESKMQCMTYCDSTTDGGEERPRTTESPDIDIEGSGEILTTLPSTGVDVCALESEHGPCKAFSRQWYYDHKAGECKQFVYSGCRGNGNRFASQAECEAQCSPREVCLLSQQSGNCMAYLPRWFFDYNEQRCREFVYGGCDGNANNFEDQDVCEKSCESLKVIRPPEVDKEGTCPSARVEHSNTNGKCIEQCRKDSDCGGSKKCCTFSCSLVCVEPEELAHPVHDCLDILRTGQGSSSGVYTIILPASGNNLQIYCDMTTDDGGWIVFQNRFDGSVDFFRNRTEYHNGFGELQGEFWLGLRYIYELSTACTDVDLRINLEKADGTKGYDIYHNFKLSPAPEYTLHLSRGSSSWRDQGSTSENMVYVNGRDFYTYDHDTQSHRCATIGHGAWWYSEYCGNVNLNGEYVQPPGGRASPWYRGMFYYSFDTVYSLKAASMMLRCKAHAG